MADFKTHITTSAVVGAGYGFLLHHQWQIPITTCVISGGLCGLAGMLPDMDSDTGNAQREIMTFTAAITPMLMLERLALLGLGHEEMVIATACVYIIVRFGVGDLLRRYTVHRGMFHSIPAAITAGLITSLVCSCEVISYKLAKAGAVTLGYFVHLMLDELWAIDLGRMRFKKSFGTAMKLFSNRWFPNVLTYGLLLVFAVLANEDQKNMQYVHHHDGHTHDEVESSEEQPLSEDELFNFGLQGEASIGTLINE